LLSQIYAFFEDESYAPLLRKMAEPSRRAEDDEAADVSVNETEFDDPETFLVTGENTGQQDVAPLGRWEKRAWIFYDFATNGYSTVAIGFFMPLLATELARRRAWHTHSRFDSVPPECSFADTSDLYCTTCVEGEGNVLRFASNGTRPGETPDVRISAGAVAIDPVAYATFCISMSILLQLAVYVLFSPAADYGSYRRTMLIVTTVVASATTFACGFVTKPDMYWLVGLLIVISNAAAGLAFVAYNSWLPLLIDAEKRVRLLDNQATEASRLNARQAVGNELSNHGYAAGYVGGVIILLISFALSGIDNLSSTEYYGVTLMLAGGWWLLFGSICITGLVSSRSLKQVVHTSKHTSVTKGKASPTPTHRRSGWSECLRSLTFGMRKMAQTLRQAWQRKQLLTFLILYFFYSDGYNTISSVGILFAKRDVCMSTKQLSIIALEVPLAAGIGNLMFLHLHKSRLLSSKGVLVINLTVIAALGLYAQLGWLNKGIGLKNAWEMYIFALVYGLQVGPVQAFSRMVFADLVPRGSEAQFFSLYQITDKGSSWLGPLIVSSVVQATNSLRLALVYIVCTLIVPAILVVKLVNHEQGMVEAGRLEKLSGLSHRSDTTCGFQGETPIDDEESTTRLTDTTAQRY
jgi:UMF1 family MFS transporter